MFKATKTFLKESGSSLIGKRSGFYRKSLLWILIVSGIPGIIIGSIMYWIADGRIGQELQKLHINQTVKRAQNIDDQFSSLELSLAHWAFDPKLNVDLKTKDWGREFQDARDITKTLLIMQGSLTLTKQMELYIRGAQPIVFNPEYHVLDNKASKDYYEPLLTEGKSVYWINKAANPDVPDKKDLTLVHKIPGGSLEPFGVILFRLDHEKLVRLLKTLTPYDEGATFIMQEDDEIIISAEDAAKSSPFDEALKKQVRENEADSGSFMMDWEKNTYTVSYGKFPRIGSNWTYVSAAPINKITAPVVMISKLILTVSIAVLVLAFVLSWVASKRIYSPVDRLVRLFAGGAEPHGDSSEPKDEFKLMEQRWRHLTGESSALRSRLEEQLPHVREGFLQQLIQGYLYAYSEQDLLGRMRHYGWTVDEQQFIVVYVQLIGFTNLKGRFSHGDEGLVTFTAANIMGELASARSVPCDVINFHDLTVGLLVHVPNDRTYKMEMQALSEEIVQAINQILKMQVAVTIGRSTCSIAEIPSLFEEARSALSYRRFVNHNQIIDIEQLYAAEESMELRYPFALEREVIQTMRTGQRQETERLIASFLEALSASGAKEIDVQQGMLQLLGSIQHAIMHSGINLNRINKGVNLFEQFLQIREPEQMLNYFYEKVIRPYMQELEARSDYHTKKIVENVMIFIQNNYMNDISLDICADLSGSTPYMLSKSFKQVTGKNFIDYLTEWRMDKAKEMLRDTELKIHDVALQVGYQHSYFNRIFKKQEGITPSQYRELSRK